MTGTSRPDAGTKALTESTIIGYLGSPAFNEDPFPAYRFFLDHPGWPSPSGYRVFARFDDVLGILRDPDTFGQPGRVDGNFHTVDPPEHTRLRKLVSRVFTFRAMSRQRRFIESVADELLDEIRPAGRMDLATDFSALLPGRVTAKLLGVDYEDGARWQSWLEAIKASRGIVHYLAPDPAEKQRADAAAAEAAKDTAAFLAELLRRRVDHDGDDIVSVLLRAQDGDDSLSDKEILCTLLLLLGAGLHTTSAQIATTMRLLLERPVILARIAADTGLLANAVEEALRYEGALQAEYRLVKRPAQVGGVRLGQGELLLIDRSPSLVAPAAAWLCHQECDVSGQFFASTAGSMRLVFASAVRGYQSPDPEAFTIEELRDHWELACSRESALMPASAAEFNDFRRSILNEKVVH